MSGQLVLTGISSSPVMQYMFKSYIDGMCLSAAQNSSCGISNFGWIPL